MLEGDPGREEVAGEAGERDRAEAGRAAGERGVDHRTRAAEQSRLGDVRRTEPVSGLELYFAAWRLAVRVRFLLWWLSVENPKYKPMLDEVDLAIVSWPDLPEG